MKLPQMPSDKGILPFSDSYYYHSLLMIKIIFKNKNKNKNRIRLVEEEYINFRKELAKEYTNNGIRAEDGLSDPKTSLTIGGSVPPIPGIYFFPLPKNKKRGNYFSPYIDFFFSFFSYLFFFFFFFSYRNAPAFPPPF